MRLPGAANMDDPGAPKLMSKHVNDQSENIIVKRTKRAVDENPRRGLYQHPRKHQAKLLVLAQFPIPAPGLVEQRSKSFQPEPEQRAGESVGTETLCLQGISKNLSQTPARQVRRAARQVEYLLAPRKGDASGTPGP